MEDVDEFFDDNEMADEDSLVFEFCPKGLCKQTSKLVLMPDKADKTELSRIMCSDNNTGIYALWRMQTWLLHIFSQFGIQMHMQQ